MKLTGEGSVLVVHGNFRVIDTDDVLVDYYGINECGCIVNLHTRCELSRCKDKDGYYKVTLCTNERLPNGKHKRKTFRVAKLVLKTWVGNPPDDIEDATVDHIDNDKTNDYYRNLRWLPRRVNSSIREHKGIGEENHEAKLTEKDVIEICNLLVSSNLSLSEIGDRFNVDKSTISNIKHKVTWKYITRDYDFGTTGVM